MRTIGWWWASGAWVAVFTLACGATRAASGERIAAPAPVPVHGTMDLARVAAMDSAILAAPRMRIEHALSRITPVPFASARPCYYSRAVPPASVELDSAWVGRFARVLGLDRPPAFGPPEECRGCGRDSSRRDRLALTFGTGSASVTADVLLDTGIATFDWNGERTPALSLRRCGADLQRLLVAALGDDTTLASIRACAFGSADTITVPSGRPGESQVLVEELPVPVRRVAPNYSDAARRAGVDGTVMVQALVAKDGAIQSTMITQSIPMLDADAVRAVEQWSFQPATAGGAPVAVWVAVPVKFTLH